MPSPSKKKTGKKRIVDRLQYDKVLTCCNKSAQIGAAFSLLFWFLLSSLSRIAVIVRESVVAETPPFEDALGPALVATNGIQISTERKKKWSRKWWKTNKNPTKVVIHQFFQVFPGISTATYCVGFWILFQVCCRVSICLSEVYEHMLSIARRRPNTWMFPQKLGGKPPPIKMDGGLHNLI